MSTVACIRPLLERALESDVEVVVRVDSAERAQTVRKLMERPNVARRR